MAKKELQFEQPLWGKAPVNRTAVAITKDRILELSEDLKKVKLRHEQGMELWATIFVDPDGPYYNPGGVRVAVEIKNLQEDNQQEFPNGFEEWSDTHAMMSVLLHDHCKEMTTGDFLDAALDFTNRFESENEGVDYDGNWLTYISDFIDQNKNELE